MMAALFHALSNMRKLHIHKDTKLFSYGEYILAKIASSTYTVVGYLSMSTYTTAAYSEIDPIGGRKDLIGKLLPSFPPQPDEEPGLSFEELHPKRPTGYEGRAY
jgi:hypothetical protein